MDVRLSKVVLEAGEQSDDLGDTEPLKEREHTGRRRLARYWNMFAHADVTEVPAHDLFTERLLSKRRQTFKEPSRRSELPAAPMRSVRLALAR